MKERSRPEPSVRDGGLRLGGTPRLVAHGDLGSAERSSLVGQFLGLQHTAGNRAVADGLGRLPVQRAPDGSADPDAQSGQASNPMFGALWQMSVTQPIHDAANAMVDSEPPDYIKAFTLVRQALDADRTTKAALPAGDRRSEKANYLSDDLNLTAVILAPRANVPVPTSDDTIASKLGELEYDAQVVGESMGGNPAPKAQLLKPEDPASKA